MTHFARTLTLAEAFGALVRMRYPKRPALADEILSEGYKWFHYWTHHPREEVKAALRALNDLEAGIVHKEYRLRGTLDLSKPLDDIDPADARAGTQGNGLHIFNRTLEIYDPEGTRKYFQVHCYEAD